MIEIQQIQFTLGLGVKKSRLRYNQISMFNTTIESWTYNAFTQYNQ